MKKFRKIMAVVLAAAMCFSVTGCLKKTSSVKNEKEVSKDFSDYKNVINVLCHSKANGDLEEFMSLFGNMDGLMRSVVTQDVFDETKANYVNECGNDIFVEWKITEEKDANADEIAEYQDTVGLFGEDGTITEAKDLTVDVNAKGDKGTYSYEMSVSVGKIDEKWIICNFNDTLLK